jgi:hypothetical protein
MVHAMKAWTIRQKGGNQKGSVIDNAIVLPKFRDNAVICHCRLKTDGCSE